MRGTKEYEEGDEVSDLSTCLTQTTLTVFFLQSFSVIIFITIKIY